MMEGHLRLAPPLKRLWSAPGSGQMAASEDGVATVSAAGNDHIVCYAPDGLQRWEAAASYPALMIDGGLLWTSSGDVVRRLWARRMDTGALLMDERCEFRLCAMVPERRAFVGFSADQLALVSLDSAKAVWVSEILQKPAYMAACDNERVFAGNGAELWALSLDDGSKVWVASLEAVGGLNIRSDPMLHEDRLIISTGNGPAAYNTRTGKLLWAFTGHGNRALYGGRVHLIQGSEYYALDVRDGRLLLRAPLVESARRKWMIRDMDPGTWPLVSDTHLFLGDGVGRFYAFDASTGEPVWYDHPKGAPGYLLSRASVVGKRIYVGTFDTAKRPGVVHCYEASDEP